MRIKTLGGPGNVGFRQEDQKAWVTATVAMTKGFAYIIDEVNLADDMSYDRITNVGVPTLTNFMVVALENCAITGRCHVMISGRCEMISDASLGTVGTACSIDSAGEAIAVPTAAGTRCFAKNLEATTANELDWFNFDGYGLLGATDPTT
jgi:hypothetical protein